MASGRTRQKRLKLAALKRRANGYCEYCNRRCDSRVAFAEPTFDHDIPKARGGPHHNGNGIFSCGACNQLKADMTAAEYRYFLTTGTLHHDYIQWLTEKALRRAKASGIIRIDVGENSAILVPVAEERYQR